MVAWYHHNIEVNIRGAILAETTGARWLCMELGTSSPGEIRLLGGWDPQDSAQFALDGRIARPGCIGSHDDHHVSGRLQRVLVAPEDLTDQPLDAVTNHRVADLPARRDAKPRSNTVVGAADDHEGRPRTPARAPLQLKIFATFSDPPRTRQSLLGNRLLQDGCLGGMLTVSRLRPLARRRLSTWRPPGVAMRARKPCVRFRRRLLGWYVRFIRSPQRRDKPPWGPAIHTRLPPICPRFGVTRN